jgi:hypothetical protein
MAGLKRDRVVTGTLAVGTISRNALACRKNYTSGGSG